jgi:ABC-2 type transport system permease protein
LPAASPVRPGGLARLGRNSRPTCGFVLEDLLAATSVAEIRTSEPPRFSPVRRLRELLSDREILGNLVRKEVKVKYKSSVLGAAWSMLNPVLYLAVFTLVFTVVLPNPVPFFPVYLLSGLLVWNLFASSTSLSSRSVVDNANLVTKVYFPREILPFASIGAAGVDFLLQALVLLLFMLAFRYGVLGLNLLLLPLSLVALLTFTAAVSLWVSALNVRYRDTQHLLNVALLAWFWLTPVVYPTALVWQKLEGYGGWIQALYLANPMTPIVMGFQRALYGIVSPDGNPVLAPVGVGWLAALLGLVTLGSAVLLALAWRTFFHLSGDFAEEL